MPGTAIIMAGCVLERLAGLDDGSVQCVVTSPPYWGLRDYNLPPSTWADGWIGCLGLEPTPEQYIAHCTEVFGEVRRVLANDGTLWLNIGDSYARTQETNVPQTKNKPVAFPHHTKAGSSDGAVGRADRPGTRAGSDGIKPKDLVGIPWMLAFALRAPYEQVNIRAHIDRAWLAGLVDGEGCLTILQTTSPHGSGDSFPPVLQVRMCDVEPIEKAAAITGFGNASPRQDPPSQGGQRGSYQWRLNGRKAVDIAAEIYPYLLVKRKQAVVIWNHQKIRDSYETKKGVRVPDAAREKQQFCRELIQRLNAHEPVDIPSWMEEPSIQVEPGWYLRSDCIWSKPNPMPESVTDRPTKAHEYLFLLSKSAKYYYDLNAIRESFADARQGRDGGKKRRERNVGGRTDGYTTPSAIDPSANGGKNRRSVWEVANTGNRERECLDIIESTLGSSDKWEAIKAMLGGAQSDVWRVAPKPYKEAHFATFPPALVEPCILAGSAPGDTVLDPFSGSGTTGVVALNHGRDYIGIELNPTYISLSADRIRKEAESEIIISP